MHAGPPVRGVPVCRSAAEQFAEHALGDVVHDAAVAVRVEQPGESAELGRGLLHALVLLGEHASERGRVQSAPGGAACRGTP